MTNLYEQACERLAEAARLEKITPDDLRAIVVPWRTVRTTLPILMDDGSRGFFQAWYCRHHESRGLSNGRLEIDPAITMEKVEGLALLGTIRGALLDLPFGGCAGGIQADPALLSENEIERLTRCFGDRLDRWTHIGGEGCIAAGGYRLVRALASELNIAETDSVSVSGLSRAAREATRRLGHAGHLIVAAGHDCGALLSVNGALDASRDTDAALGTRCAVLVLGGPAGTVNLSNAALIRAHVVLELTDGAIDASADAVLKERGITVVPDVLAAAGGALERHLERKLDGGGGVWTGEQLEDWLTRVIVPAAQVAWSMAQDRGITLRQAAHVLALRRLSVEG